MSEEGSRGPAGLLTAPEWGICGTFFELCKRENRNEAVASPRNGHRLSPCQKAQKPRKPLALALVLDRPSAYRNLPHRKHKPSHGETLFICLPRKRSPSLRLLHRPLSWTSSPWSGVSWTHPIVRLSHPDRISHFPPEFDFTGNDNSIHPLTSSFPSIPPLMVPRSLNLVQHLIT